MSDSPPRGPNRASGPAGSRAAAATLAGVASRLVRQWGWPMLALTAACAAVAATIAGALGVGDALQNGLRGLALERLGGISAIVVADDFFRADLVRDLDDSLVGGQVMPAIVLEVSLEGTGPLGGEPRRARATMLACPAPGELGFSSVPPPLSSEEVAINESLASSLDVRAGDAVVLRIAKRSDVPSDSPLGRRLPESLGRRLKVAAVLPDRGVGRFSLRPSQVTPGVAIVALETAQGVLRRGDVANTGLATGDVDAESLRRALRPTLADYGLSLEEVPTVNGGAVRLSSRKLLIPPEVDRVAADILPGIGGTPTLAFLVNELAVDAGDSGGAPSIPYSTLLGIDDTRLPVGTLVGPDGAPLALPADGEIVIDQWVADDLARQGHPVIPGDEIQLRMFLPETLHGSVEEASHRLRISGVARMEGVAVERTVVPEVEGITDEKSIADWDPPFPFDRSRVRTVPPDDEDDRYWKAHGATPKAFVSLGCGRRLAASRFGGTSAWFLPPLDAAGREALAGRLAEAFVPERLGIRVESSRADALAAARGSTPFGGLFLALSSFVVVAGLLLEWLLFHLLVASRRRDVGLLAAIGWAPRRIARLLLLVGAAAILVGAIVGTAVGPAWARILLRWMAASWNTAVASGSAAAFGDGQIRWGSLLPGAVGSAVLSAVAVAWAARRAASQPPLTLLRGGGDASSVERPSTSRRASVLAVVALSSAVAVAAVAGRGDAQAAVGLFFLSGALALAGWLALVRRALAAPATGSTPLRSLAGLAWRGVTHRPVRAFSIAAMVAVAEFLIVAVSAFSIGDAFHADDRAGPTGGYSAIATFAEPTGLDPGDVDSADRLGLSDADRQALGAAVVDKLRASGGDDASCTNLYAPARPVVLGVGPGFVERRGFRFTSHLPLPAGSDGNPWRLLSGRTGEPIPAILDDATARWALKLGGLGATFTLPDDEGRGVEFRIVGLLEPGILQGWVIVGEGDFRRTFPSRSGYSLALVDAAAAPPRVVEHAVAAAWADAGVAVESARGRWRRLSAVQNTFLAAFQALGTLGLLLGTAGVAATQVQGVLERLGTFGLLGAVGFPARRIRALVLGETVLMVGLGLAAGAAAGAMTLPAHLAGGRASLPLAWIGATCLLTLVVALMAGWLATRAVDRLSPREALLARR